MLSFVLSTAFLAPAYSAECAAFVDNWNKIRSINSLTIPQLNIRAWPCDEVCLDEWNQKLSNATTELQQENITNWIQASSFSGYIDESETFLEVLALDWESVCNKMNTTHIELATHMKHIMSLYDTFGNPIVDYNASSLEWNTLPQKKPQRILVKREESNGFQWSMFQNIGNTDGFNDLWSCTWSFTNLDTGLTLGSVGANCYSTDGIYDYRGQITWIEQFGFYEGHTPYRLDPGLLYSMIVGI